MSDPFSDQPAWTQQLGRSTGNHYESMVAVAEGLLIEMPDMTRRLKQAVLEGNAADIQRYAHTLKSSLRYICQGREIELAQQIEDAGQNQQLAQVPELLAQLLPIVSNWQSQIDQWLKAQ